LVQSLAIISMKLSALMKDRQPVHISQSLEDIDALIVKLTKESRSLSFELSSPLLYEIGFEAAIERLVEQVCKRHNLRYEFRDDGRNKGLNQESCVLLYQAVRELLINVVKHARADTVIVSIYRKSGSVNIRVSDNGTGFNHLPYEKRLYSRQGFGLFAVNERIQDMGGHFDLVSEPNNGTRVTLSVPFTSSSN